MTGTERTHSSRRLAVHGFVRETAPVRVVFGTGTRDRLPDELDRIGLHRVLLIGGTPPLAGVADDLAAALGATVGARIIDHAQHVPASDARAAITAAAEARVDGIVAIGGGSAVGLAKVIALDTGLPVIAVPTTYAGSEMTDMWGRTDDRDKVTGRAPRVRPRCVIYDVELTLGMPAELTATSGLNALAHCAEAAYDSRADPITVLLAIEGARALTAALPAAVADGHDVTARSETLYGAWLAGSALGSARMGVHHRLCRPRRGQRLARCCPLG